jgi:hypothetical protein
MVLLIVGDPALLKPRVAQLANSAMQVEGAGLMVLAVPGSPGRLLASSGSLLVSEGNTEIHETYALFARTFSDEQPIAEVRHVEWLVDRQGFLRARWVATEGEAWRSVDALLKQALTLRAEKPRAQAPDDHVH